MREYLLVLLVAAGTTYLLAGLCRRLAVLSGAYAMVRDRDVHTKPIPYFGGVAMMVGLAVSLLLAIKMPFLGKHALVEHDAMGVLLAGLVICLVGVLDDVFDLPALVKLGGQFLAAGVAVMQGVRIFWIPLPNRIFSPDDATSILLTLFIIVLCVNAVNFVDGLDGLAAGVVAIGAGAFFSYAYFLAYEQNLTRATTASLITIATCGICLGFLMHNFRPARMFMGDSGSMLLGLLMAMSTISFTGQLDPAALAENDSVLQLLPPILLPVAALALPLLDLILAWARRAARGEHPFKADKQHLHHRLLDHGHSYWGAVLIMYGWTAVLSVGLALFALGGHTAVGWSILLAIALMMFLTAFPRGKKRLAVEPNRASGVPGDG